MSKGISVDIGNAKDVKHAWQQFLLLLVAEPEMAKDEIRKYLRTKFKEEIKEGLKDTHVSVLAWGIEYLGLPTEDYELCQAFNEAIAERPTKPPVV